MAILFTKAPLRLAVIRGPKAGGREDFTYPVHMTVRTAESGEPALVKALLPRQDRISALENGFLALAADRFRDTIAQLDALGPQHGREQSLTYTLLASADLGRGDLQAAEDAAKRSIDALTGSMDATPEDFARRHADLAT